MRRTTSVTSVLTTLTLVLTGIAGAFGMAQASPLTPVVERVGVEKIVRLPQVDSQIGIGTSLGPQTPPIELGLSEDDYSGALIRVTTFDVSDATDVFAQDAQIMHVEAGSASTSVLVPIEGNTVALSATREVDARVEVLMTFKGAEAPGATVALPEPVTRANTEIGLGGDNLSATSTRIGVTGEGGVPSENVRAVWITATIDLAESQQVQIDGQQFMLPAGITSVNTVVTPGDDGSIEVAVAQNYAALKLDVRGYVVESTQNSEHHNVEGSYVPVEGAVPVSQSVSQGIAAPLPVGKLAGTKNQLVMISATTDSATTGLISADNNGTARGVGAVVDPSNGALPQLIVVNDDYNVTVSQGQADIVALGIGAFAGDIESRQAQLAVTIDELNDDSASLNEAGAISLTGSVSTDEPIDRIEITANGEIIGTASITYTRDGSTWEFISAVPESGEYTFGANAITRSGSSALVEETLDVTLPDADDVVLMPQAHILSLRTAALVTELTDSTVVFSDDPGFKPGDIIVSNVSESAPFGFMRRVVTVNKVNDQWEYQTEIAQFNEVFAQVDFVGHQDLLDPGAGGEAAFDAQQGAEPGDEVPWDLERVDEPLTTLFETGDETANSGATQTLQTGGFAGGTGGVQAGSPVNAMQLRRGLQPLASFEWGASHKHSREGYFKATTPERLEPSDSIADDEWTSDLKGNLVLKYGWELRMGGTFALTVSTQWSWGIPHPSIDYVKVSTTVEAERQLAIAANLELETKREDTLFSVKLPPATFWAGPVPIPFTFEIGADFTTSISAALETELESASGVLREVGIEYSNGSLNPLNRVVRKSGDRDLKVNGSASGTVSIELGFFVKTKICDLAGPELKFGLEVGTELAYKTTSFTDIDGTFKVFAKGKAKISFEIGVNIGKFIGIKMEVGAIETKQVNLFELRITSSSNVDIPVKEHGHTVQQPSNDPDNGDSSTQPGGIPSRIASQDLGYCETNVLPRNDDGSIEEPLHLPFMLSFFGKAYNNIYVNNNGNITFDAPLNSYTPWAMSDDSGIPMIAPFFADVDTRASGSREVTYGLSDDGKTLCVNWIGVGYYDSRDDKLNSFQLLLEHKGSSGGRAPGDFDIVFNYDGIRWETGSASGGSNGFGGSSAVVGYSAGTGEPGTWFQIEGSGDNGALLDRGINSLIKTSRSSSDQPGRHRFEIRANAEQTVSGSVSGTVTDESGQPISGAMVGVVGVGADQWFVNTFTNDAGKYVFNGLPATAVEVVANPPSDRTLTSDRYSATLVAGQPLVTNLILTTPRIVAEDIVMTQDDVQLEGSPSIYTDSTLVSGVRNCVPGAGTVRLVQDGRTLFTENLVQSDNDAIATWPEVDGHSGAARLIIEATCNGETRTRTVDVYLDPSGKVLDQNGSPIPNALVTLYRADSSDGDMRQVLNGAPLLSPGNRINPMLTDYAGRYGWDVMGGYYRVKAEAFQCTGSDGTTGTWSNVLPVPPEQLDVTLELQCQRDPNIPDKVVVIDGEEKVASADLIDVAERQREAVANQ